MGTACAAAVAAADARAVEKWVVTTVFLVLACTPVALVDGWQPAGVGAGCSIEVVDWTVADDVVRQAYRVRLGSSVLVEYACMRSRFDLGEPG